MIVLCVIQVTAALFVHKAIFLEFGCLKATRHVEGMVQLRVYEGSGFFLQLLVMHLANPNGCIQDSMTATLPACLFDHCKEVGDGTLQNRQKYA